MSLIPVQFHLVTVFKRIHLYHKLFLYGTFPKEKCDSRGLLFQG